MSTPAESSPVSLETHALIVLACAVSYFYAFQLNTYFFANTEFAHGVNWVFIPSGLRLLFVLLFTLSGGIGVAAGSIAINYLFDSPEAHVYNIVTGLLSGLAPYLARAVGIRFFHLDAQLSGFTSGSFLKISILFAIICSSLHQVWFYIFGKADNFVSATFAMAIGDWVGTVLVLAAASLVLKIIQKLKPPAL